jgi:site-specific DNA-methyltransferase (adenine-specific)
MEKKDNVLYTNDNLYIMNGMNSQSVDLIYLDPPFNSKRMYAAPIGTKSAGASFKDMWSWKDIDESYLETMTEKYPALVSFITSAGKTYDKSMMAYLTYMAQRIIEMRRILKNTGSIYLHCDATASHYLKVVMDEIFGKNNFRNEIAWCYKSRPQPKKYFGKKHDIILFYTKSDNYAFNWKSVARDLSNSTVEK